MKVCYELAQHAATKGNSPVGAVIVRGEEIVSRGEEAVKTKNDITSHAEIEAIRQAVIQLKTKDLSECVLYSTHEPCIMCAYAIRFHKIGKVVYRNKAAYLGGASSSMPLLITTEVPPHWNAPPVIIHLDPGFNASGKGS